MTSTDKVLCKYWTAVKNLSDDRFPRGEMMSTVHPRRLKIGTWWRTPVAGREKCLFRDLHLRARDRCLLEGN